MWSLENPWRFESHKCGYSSSFYLILGKCFLKVEGVSYPCLLAGLEGQEYVEGLGEFGDDSHKALAEEEVAFII